MSRRSSGRRLRFRLAVSQGWLCHYCRRPMTREDDGPRCVTVDHRVPRSLGGDGRQTNLVAACKQCNNAKADSLEPAYHAPAPRPSVQKTQHDAEIAKARAERKMRERLTMWREAVSA